MKNIYLNGVIESGGDISLKSLQNEIKNEKEIKIYLNSEGGSVDEGKKIYDYLINLQNEGCNIDIVASGYCYSMASVILCSVPIEKRYIYENASVMLHYPLVDIFGNSFELKETAIELEQLNKWFVNLYSKRTKIENNILQDLLIKEKIINADEAINLGIVSKKIETIKAVAFFINKNENLKKMDVIKTLKEALNNLLESEKKEVQAIELMGNDNYKIISETETLEEGATIQVYEGEKLVENFTGEITLDDGTIIAVESNVIITITTPSEETTEEIDAIKKELEALKIENSELKKTIEETTAQITEFNTAIGKSFTVAKKQIFVKNIEKKEKEISEVQALILERKRIKNNKK